MIAGKNNRAVCRYIFKTGNVDSPEEGVGSDTDQGNDKTMNQRHVPPLPDDRITLRICVAAVNPDTASWAIIPHRNKSLIKSIKKATGESMADAAGNAKLGGRRSDNEHKDPPFHGLYKARPTLPRCASGQKYE
jgi:hypothetical protein